jgi:hypothetical protein
MQFDLDLAIAYACALGLFCLLATWFVPLALRAIVNGAVALYRALTHAGSSSNPPGGAHVEQVTEWWGPHHSH